MLPRIFGKFCGALSEGLPLSRVGIPVALCDHPLVPAPLGEGRSETVDGAHAVRSCHGEPTSAVWGAIMKNCKLCGFSRVCNDLPGFCVLLQYAAVFVLVAALGYLFITQELLA